SHFGSSALRPRLLLFLHTCPAPGAMAADGRGAAPALSSHTKGVLVTIAGVVCLSPDIVLVRYAELQLPQANCVVLHKYLFKLLATFVGLGLVAYGGPRGYLAQARAAGWHFWAAAVLQCVQELLFTLGALHTTAADNLVFLSLSPLWCALFSVVWFQEWPQRHTALALVVSLGAVALAFWGGTREEAASGRQSVLGNTIALCCGVAMAALLTVCRHAEIARLQATLVPAALPASVFSVALGVVLAQGRVGEECWPASGVAGLVPSALNGAALLPVADALFAIAPKYILSSEVGMFMLLELVLGPFLVWIAMRETPSPWTLVGGVILMVALACNEYMSLRHEVAALAAKAPGASARSAGAADPPPREGPRATESRGAAGDGDAAREAAAEVWV
ncbi:unnamed protein product, partial [Prorocentrum cordatum]